MQSVKKENKSAIQHFILQPARFRLDGGAMFGIIPKPLWNKKMPADELNRIDLALRLWLIKTVDRLVLVDTGIGDYHGDQFDDRFDVRGDKSPLEKSLEDIGFSCDDLTDLVISHLHFDHVGGICKRDESGELIPLFKKTRLHVHEDHLKYSQAPTMRDAGSFHVKTFMPIVNWYKDNNLLHLYKGEEGELFELGSEKLRFKCSHGHTPWLMHPYNDQYIYMADLIPTSNHVNIPWVMGYDIAPGETTRNKVDFLDFTISKDLKAIYEHDPKVWGSKIAKDEKGRYVASEHFESVSKNAYQV